MDLIQEVEMSITIETAKAHANDIAVTCCRFEAGGVIAPDNLEDPGIFPDLEDSGLLVFPEGALTIGEALGATLKETADSLTVLTRDMVTLPETPFLGEDEAVPAEETMDAPVEITQEAGTESVSQTVSDDYITIYIGEGKDITLKFPC